MYVEPLQERGWIAYDLPVDTWVDDEVTRDGVWLYGADVHLRREFLKGDEGDLGPLAPSLEDVRIGGASGDCALLDPNHFGHRHPGLRVFVFAGDAVKWYTRQHDELGLRDAYQGLAEEIAVAAEGRWRLPHHQVEQFVARQTLIWSIQALRIKKAPLPDVGQVLQELGDIFGPHLSGRAFGGGQTIYAGS